MRAAVARMRPNSTRLRTDSALSSSASRTLSELCALSSSRMAGTASRSKRSYSASASLSVGPSRIGPSLLCASMRQAVRTSDCSGPLLRLIRLASHTRSDSGMAPSSALARSTHSSLTSAAAFLPARRPKTRANSMCCRSTSIACMSKIVGALVRCKRFYEFSNQPPEFLHGALGAFAQRSFEFRERHLDGIEVWRICRQIAECCTDSVDCLAHPVDLVGPQIIREHDVAFCQRWREHLLDIGHERGSIHRTIDDIRCSQAVDAQARNERQRFPVAVRDTRDEALATRSATGMANHFGRHRRLINKNEPLAP